MLAAIILICIALIILGVALGKPYGWLALGFAVVALLIVTLNLFHLVR
jgi:hypothetical protein